MALPERLTDDLNELSSLWLAAKEAEREAIEDRRRIEDRIKSLVGVAETLEGTKVVDPDQYTIKIVGRIDRKVDSNKLQEMAAEYGLTDHLSYLFRWKPEVNMAAWKAAAPSITKPLSAAITAKPGRPSFTIIPKEQ
jgi:hypothetical protein